MYNIVVRFEKIAFLWLYVLHSLPSYGWVRNTESSLRVIIKPQDSFIRQILFKIDKFKFTLSQPRCRFSSQQKQIMYLFKAPHAI